MSLEVKPIPPQWVNDVELDEFGHASELCFEVEVDGWDHLTAFPGLLGAFHLSRTGKGRDGRRDRGRSSSGMEF